MKLFHKEDKDDFVRLDKILELNALYNILFGKRSNGKSYAVLEYMFTQYWVFGEEFVIIRRNGIDFEGVRGATMFEGLSNNSVVTDLTGGEWTGITYYSRRWYLSRYDDEKRKVIKAENPMGYAFALTQMSHDKSTSYPRVKNILFDEFAAAAGEWYLPNEFVIFMNTLSTIIRNRGDVKIFMCGNTTDAYSIYFKEMGLNKAKNMRPGDIQLYEYGQNNLTVAVEYTDARNSTKESDKYFAFDNPQLAMITNGDWQIQPYPHKPCDFKPKDIVFTYFIDFEDEMLQCEVVALDEMMFTFIHRKTTPLKDETKDLIFSQKVMPYPNWKRRLNNPQSPLTKKLYAFFKEEKVFYQDNRVGEAVRAYLRWCNTTPII